MLPIPLSFALDFCVCPFARDSDCLGPGLPLPWLALILPLLWGYRLCILRLLVSWDADDCLCTGLLPYPIATASVYIMNLCVNKIAEDSSCYTCYIAFRYTMHYRALSLSIYIFIYAVRISFFMFSSCSSSNRTQEIIQKRKSIQIFLCDGITTSSL